MIRKKQREGKKMSVKIKVNQGILEGRDCGDYMLFCGVPYAKPPVGDLRWKAPQEMEPWDGVRNAGNFQAAGVQNFPDPNNMFTGGYAKEFYSNPEFMREISEDCLYLNIWAPKDMGERPYPVAFWLHGGAFSGGFSSEIEFDGEEYCRKGVILVTVEYRLNIFGFLAHPWLDAENEEGISGNYGILDQIAALKWVYENIEAFGGDRDRITVFGQSAGSMSTQVLVSSPLTEGMIAGAIMQSGVSCSEEILLTPTKEEEEVFGRIFVELAGVSSIEELRALSTEKIHETFGRFEGEMWKRGNGLVLVPNVDGHVLEHSVKEIWKKGEMRKIPYMLGTVTDDLGAVREDVEKKQPGILQKECERWALTCEKATGCPSYLYFFSHELPGDGWGAFHSSELWYMFGTYGRCWRPMGEEDRKLSEEMVECWTSFIKSGKPGSEGTEEWRPYKADDVYIRQF